MEKPSSKIKPPIIILGNPRSGTSAISAIFDAHGVWNDKIGGRHRFDTSPGSYCSFEWRSLKRTIKPPRSPLFNGTLPIISDQKRKQIDAIIRKECPYTKDWLFKGTPEYFSAFTHLNPRVILLHREHKNTIASQLKRTGNRGHLTEQEHWDLLHKRYNLMENIASEYNGHWINADNILNGNMNELPEIFEAVGLTFNPEKAENALDKKLWHFKKK